jgi:hypothetical protein
LVLISVSPVRDRFVGLFDVRPGASSAGGSLAYRLIAYSSGLKAISEYPLGFGLFLRPLSSTTSDIYGEFARVNDYFETRGLFFSGDNWFQWLMVQIGVPGFSIYACLFLVPIIWGMKYRKRIRDDHLRHLMNGLLALIIAAFVGGVSNSPLLTFPPSNLLIWAAVGILMRAPDWDKKLYRDSVAHANRY